MKLRDRQLTFTTGWRATGVVAAKVERWPEQRVGRTRAACWRLKPGKACKPRLGAARHYEFAELQETISDEAPSSTTPHRR